MNLATMNLDEAITWFTKDVITDWVEGFWNMHFLFVSWMGNVIYSDRFLCSVSFHMPYSTFINALFWLLALSKESYWNHRYNEQLSINSEIHVETSACQCFPFYINCKNDTILLHHIYMYVYIYLYKVHYPECRGTKWRKITDSLIKDTCLHCSSES